MPCNDPNHAAAAPADCVACFTADALTLLAAVNVRDPDWSALNVRRTGLNERYGALKLVGDAAESCRSIVSELNMHLARQKIAGVGVAVIQPYQIHPAHRDLYRAGLRAMGTWIGLTELHLLGRAFSLRFSLAFATGPHWRCVVVGAPSAAPTTAVVLPTTHALQWDGVHYQVAQLTAAVVPNQHGVATTIATNPHGDCAFESFLIMVAAVPLPQQAQVLGAPHAAAKGVITAAFANAWGRRNGGIVPRDDVDYIAAITGLRALLADPAVLDDEAVDLAIIADGELPEEKSAEESGSDGPKKAAPKLADLFGALPRKAGEAVLKHVAEGSPSAVRCVVNGVEVEVVAGDAHGYALAGCRCTERDKKQGECEHSVSQADGEVDLLSALQTYVLAHKAPNLQAIIFGPYGACNGCKDRIATFVARWQAASTKAETLEVLYVYGRVDPRSRGKAKLQTVYGSADDEYGNVSGKRGEEVHLHAWGPVNGSK